VTARRHYEEDFVQPLVVTKDVNNGWTFSSTIVLTGTYCQDMLAGHTTDVQGIFGCKDEPPHPSSLSRPAASTESRPWAFTLLIPHSVS
jgi:hypothetical protein